MIIKINTKSETPIYLQLRNEVVKGIGKGEFEIGESLPTVRQKVLSRLTGERELLSVIYGILEEVQMENFRRSLQMNWNF